MSKLDQMRKKIEKDKGFIAALDQSGGSTPKALKLYGLNEDAWSNEQEMYDVVHKMRTRIVTSPAFSGKRLIGAILFNNFLILSSPICVRPLSGPLATPTLACGAILGSATISATFPNAGVFAVGSVLTIQALVVFSTAAVSPEFTCAITVTAI